MESLTKTRLDPATIRRLVAGAPGIGEVDGIRELDEGCYNASYAFHARDGRAFVLKVAPPPDLDILGYEREILRTEVRFLKRVRDKVPCPAVAHTDFSRTRIPSDFYVMNFLPGSPLTHFNPISSDIRRALYTELATHCAAMHRIPGPHFGYPVHRDRLAGRTCRDVFLTMVEMALADGGRRRVEYPLPTAELRAALVRNAPAFDAVHTPVLVHFDLWDGNLFVDGMTDTPHITGIVDFERGFWGDPCADFCQLMGYLDLDQEPWFFDAYNATAKSPFVFGDAERLRTLLYRIYLTVIMITECCYRDVNGSYDAQLAWAREHLAELVGRL